MLRCIARLHHPCHSQILYWYKNSTTDCVVSYYLTAKFDYTTTSKSTVESSNDVIDVNPVRRAIDLWSHN